MATSGGPNTTTEGLVFGYDTGYPLVSGSHETYKFNKGEPTTNKLNDNILGTGNGASLGEDSFGTYIQLADQTTSYSRLQVPNITVVSNEVYTWSFEIYLLETMTRSGNYTFDTNEYSDQFPSSNDASRVSATHNRPDTIYANQWTPISLTVTMGDNLTGAYSYDFFNFYYPGFQNQKVYYRNMQFETKGHKSPYAGQGKTRSVSGSLIDLTRTHDIDLSNVSFDSNAQMTFDGTDDILNTGMFSGRNPSTDPFTVEAIIKSDVTSGNKIWLDATGNGSNQRLYSALDDGGGNPLGIQGSAWSNPVPSTTDYIHQTVVMDGSTARSYRNGVASYTKSYTSYTLSGQINIGGRSGYRWNGEIPLVKIYDRALSASEVKQNYNALKNRFNI